MITANGRLGKPISWRNVWLSMWFALENGISTIRRTAAVVTWKSAPRRSPSCSRRRASWRKIVAREEFNLEVPFEGNRTRIVAIEEVSPRIPLQAGQNGDDYVIYIGLALTPDELRYNQENR